MNRSPPAMQTWAASSLFLAVRAVGHSRQRAGSVSGLEDGLQRIKIYYRFVGYLEVQNMAVHQTYKADTRKGVAVEYLANSTPA